MLSSGIVTAAYIVAAILFIFSLAGLSRHESSQRGNPARLNINRIAATI